MAVLAFYKIDTFLFKSYHQKLSIRGLLKFVADAVQASGMAAENRSAAVIRDNLGSLRVSAWPGAAEFQQIVRSYMLKLRPCLSPSI